MPAVVVPKVCRLAVKCTLGDDTDVLNIFHMGFANDGPYSDLDLGLMSSDFLDQWDTAFLPALSASLSRISCTAKDLSVLDGAEATTVPTGTDTGAISGNTLPAQVAMVISWKESISYRGGHPRTYLPGIPASEQSDAQHVTSAYAATLTSASNSFIAALAGHTWPAAMGAGQLSVVHYRINDTVQTPPKVNPLQSGVVASVFASQRRRTQR